MIVKNIHSDSLSIGRKTLLAGGFITITPGNNSREFQDVLFWKNKGFVEVTDEPSGEFTEIKSVVKVEPSLEAAIPPVIEVTELSDNSIPHENQKRKRFRPAEQVQG